MEDIFSIFTPPPPVQLHALHGLHLTEQCQSRRHTSILQTVSSYLLKWRNHMTPSESRMSGITAVIEVFCIKCFSLKNKDFQKTKLWERARLNFSSSSWKDNFNKVWRLLKYSILIYWKEHLFWNYFCFTCFNVYRCVHFLLKRSKSSQSTWNCLNRSFHLPEYQYKNIFGFNIFIPTQDENCLHVKGKLLLIHLYSAIKNF